MRKRPLTIALAVAAVPLLGGVTYAAASSVSTHPSPEVVIPHPKSADDPAGHDVNDDHGDDNAPGATTPTTVEHHDGVEDRSGPDGGDSHGGSSGPSVNSGPGSTSSGSGDSGSGSSGDGGSGRHGGDG